MSDSFIDHLPSHERERIRKRLRTPEAYEALREKVKGPEDLEREMDRNAKMAELRFALESEPKIRESMHRQFEADLKREGIEQLLEERPSAEAERKIREGKFQLKVSAHPMTHQDQLMVMPEGNVQEKIPFSQQGTERYVSQFLQSK